MSAAHGVSAAALPDGAPMRAALQHAVSARDYDTPALREAVVGFGAEARVRGVPPERVLIALKDTLNARDVGEISDWWRAVLTDRFVRWGVEGYYRIDLRPDSARDA